jgi:UDP-glucose 4-epimerase
MTSEKSSGRHLAVWCVFIRTNTFRDRPLLDSRLSCYPPRKKEGSAEMRYFLTGATGFIGGHVAQQLAAAGHKVVALVRDPSKAANLATLNVALHKGDITDKESMRRPMTGVDGVFHIAAWYKIGEGTLGEARTINVQGTRNVLELMRELRILKGVYTSTLVHRPVSSFYY